MQTNHHKWAYGEYFRIIIINLQNKDLKKAFDNFNFLFRIMKYFSLNFRFSIFNLKEVIKVHY